jgi:hypothetical protein
MEHAIQRNENADEQRTMHLLALVASKPQQKIAKTRLADRIRTPGRQVDGRRAPNPCYSPDRPENVIAALVEQGYLQERIRFGSGCYYLSQLGQSKLKELRDKHDVSGQQRRQSRKSPAQGVVCRAVRRSLKHWDLTQGMYIKDCAVKARRSMMMMI